MFRATVFCIIRLKCWKIMLTRRRITRRSFSLMVRMSRPSISMVPSVGVSSRLTQRISVDLPAPDMPIMPCMSPLRMVRLIPSSAVTAVAPVPYTFLSPEMRIMGFASAPDSAIFLTLLIR